MNRAVVLDTGPLGMVTHRGGVPEVDACKRWLLELAERGVRIGIPEIADYEVRRELIRAGKVRGIERLDALLETFEYLPLPTVVMRDAALLWADVRRRGQPTADPKALDADVILAAQARRMDVAEVVVATTNVQHLSRLVDAKLWREVVAGSD
jgi:predicted nucleic acid-binding protein